MRLIDAAAASIYVCEVSNARCRNCLEESTAKGGSADLGVEYTFDLLSRFGYLLTTCLRL